MVRNWERAGGKNVKGVCLVFFSVVLGLLCCTQALSSCHEQGLLFIVVQGLPTVVPSLVAEHRLKCIQASVFVAHGFSSCGTRAKLLRGM